MSRLQWKEEYSVGDPRMDFQHQGLFRLIDRLEDTSLDGNSMRTAFKELDLYVEEHLNDEEEILKLSQYPDYEPHCRLHDEFREWLKVAKGSLNMEHADVLSVGHNLQVFLRDWLLSHILTSDQAYKDWLLEEKKKAG